MWTFLKEEPTTCELCKETTEMVKSRCEKCGKTICYKCGCKNPVDINNMPLAMSVHCKVCCDDTCVYLVNPGE